MKRTSLPRVKLVLRLAAAALILVAMAPAVDAHRSDAPGGIPTLEISDESVTVAGTRFVHTSTAANVVDNWTYIDHPATNGHPDALLQVTQNWNPGGDDFKYNDHVIGVWYSNTASKWAIFNQDLADMPEGAHFNVLIPPDDATTFVHAVTAANTDGHITYLDHPALNDDPDAILLVTQNWNPGGVGGRYNDHPIQVWYAWTTNRWAIYNPDRADLSTGAAFNVLLPPAVGTIPLVHTATAGDITLNWTTIDHPITNGNPNAIVLVTQHWGPGGAVGQDNDHPVGAWYDSRTARWAIFNQDLADMPEDAAFNVLLFAYLVYIPIPPLR
jgi:hypothetical protein